MLETQARYLDNLGHITLGKFTLFGKMLGGGGTCCLCNECYFSILSMLFLFSVTATSPTPELYKLQTMYHAEFDMFSAGQAEQALLKTRHIYMIYHMNTERNLAEPSPIV